MTNVAYTYDALDRIETETSGGITHQYQYDLAGNIREKALSLLKSNKKE